LPRNWTRWPYPQAFSTHVPLPTPSHICPTQSVIAAQHMQHDLANSMISQSSRDTRCCCSPGRSSPGKLARVFFVSCVGFMCWFLDVIRNCIRARNGSNATSVQTRSDGSHSREFVSLNCHILAPAPAGVIRARIGSAHGHRHRLTVVTCTPQMAGERQRERRKPTPLPRETPLVRGTGSSSVINDGHQRSSSLVVMGRIDRNLS
jgi:hypothetical protein